MREKYKNPAVTGAYLGFVLITTILAISTFLISGHQAMTVVGFVGIILFLYSLRNLTKQEIEMENLREMKPLILTTLGGNFGYLLATSLALILFYQKEIASNHILGIGISLCLIAMVLLELRLTKTKDKIAKEVIKRKQKIGS